MTEVSADLMLLAELRLLAWLLRYLTTHAPGNFVAYGLGLGAAPLALTASGAIG